MTKTELINGLADESKSIILTFEAMSDAEIFRDKHPKWSIAGHIEHLVLAAKPVVLAFSLPAFILRITFGKPRHEGKKFSVLEQEYYKKLEAGGKASKPYIPKQLETRGNKTDLIENFINTHHKLERKINSWSEAQLDQYVLPHPLLGKITLREMIYFTIFHIRHHHNSIKI